MLYTTGHGYLIPLTDLLKVIQNTNNENHYRDVLKLLEDNDDEEGKLEILSAECEVLGFPTPDCIIKFSDEDNYPYELESGVDYLGYERSQLYTIHPTSEHSKMREYGIKPDCFSWSKIE